mmetsp:Transcript_23008/g.54990  ORF Transcript_23008/g.54990 Transcript_23008/m.54990 type:complete len:286 (+) Transcript_23008:687-1544(+)
MGDTRGGAVLVLPHRCAGAEQMPARREDRLGSVEGVHEVVVGLERRARELAEIPHLEGVVATAGQDSVPVRRDRHARRLCPDLVSSLLLLMGALRRAFRHGPPVIELDSAVVAGSEDVSVRCVARGGGGGALPFGVLALDHRYLLLIRGVDVPEADRPVDRARHAPLLVLGVPPRRERRRNVSLGLDHIVDVHVPLGKVNLPVPLPAEQRHLVLGGSAEELAAGLRILDRSHRLAVPGGQLPERLHFVVHPVEIPELEGVVVAPRQQPRRRGVEGHSGHSLLMPL